MKPVVLTQIVPSKAVEAQLRERYTLLGPYRNAAEQLEADGQLDQVRAVITTGGGGLSRQLIERMPQLDGTRQWSQSKAQDTEKPMEVQEYLDRRVNQDPDLWIVELDIARGERFIAQ